ncbi:hypothetical protein TNCV_1656911 [Trichonephila clavipes]|nr:hypothetical protein TNCV_1656911 [Trichonephila clavipes]
MLQEGRIRPIQSPCASPVVLTRKKYGLPPDCPEAYRFAMDNRKLNTITKYPRYPLPVMDDLITNVPHTGIMSTLDLKSSYFQLAISPKDIEKTTFITRNVTFGFFRMPFGLSGAVPNFQKVIANTLFENYISCYGASISLISDNGPQFISEIFEHLSHRLDIKHMKTLTYRPQANLTERVNRNLVQMIAWFVEENYENWDRFLHEFAFALRTSVNETTNKTPAELFLGRKIITPFSKLINVTEGAEYVETT